MIVVNGFIEVSEFRYKNNNWKIVGVKSTGYLASDCLDIIKNLDTGEYLEVKRSDLALIKPDKVYSKFEQKIKNKKIYLD